MKIHKLTTITLAVCTATLTSFAADKDKAGSAKVSAMDKAMMQMIAFNDMTEIQLAKAAQQKATSEQIKHHAQRMIQDHTKTSTELKQLAKQQDVDLKEELPPEKKAVIEEITSKSAGEFDKAYMAHELAGHRVAVATFQNVSELSQIPEFQQFGQKYLPVIQEHLSMVSQGGQHQHTTGTQNSGAAGTAASGGSQKSGAAASGTSGSSTASGAARPSGAAGTQQGASGQQSQGTVGAPQ